MTRLNWLTIHISIRKSFLVGFLFVLSVSLSGCSSKKYQHTLINIDGGKLHMPASEKKLTWVNFWSISCPPCLKELPVLEKLHQKNKDTKDIQILTVAMYYDPPHLIKDVQSRLKLTLPIGLDLDGTIAASFKEDMLIPSHYLLDSTGKVLYSHAGEISQAELEDKIQMFLKGQ